MRRFINQLRLDVSIQWRNGFYLVSALLLAPTAIILQYLGDEALAWALPLILFQNTIVNTFFFISGQILLEQTEGTLGALAATPLRPIEYLASKISTLTALSTAEGVLLAMLAFEGPIDMLPLVVGLLGLGVLLSLGGVLVISRYESINAFLMPAVAWQLLVCLPMFRVFGLLSTPLLVLHPLEPPLRALEAAFSAPATALAPVGWFLAPLAWGVPLALLALGPARTRPKELTG